MYVDLRERNGNAARIENLFGCFGEIEIYGPIIRSFDPNAEIEDERAISVFAETNKGCMRGVIMDNEFMCCSEICQGFLDEFDVGIVGGADFQIDTADLVYTVINNCRIGKSTVGHGDNLIIRCVDHGIKNADILDCTALTIGFDEITDMERLENKNHDAACEIGKATLERKTDGKTARCDDSSNSRTFNAEIDGDDADKDDVKSNLDDVNDECLRIGVDLGEFFAATDEFEDPFNENGSEEEHEKCAEDCETVRNGEIPETFPKFGEEFFHFEIPLFKKFYFKGSLSASL